MASVAFSAQYILPIRGRTARPATKPQARRAIQWSWRAIADAASGIAFLGTLGWATWHLGVQLLQIAGALESQVAATGASGLF